MADRKTEVVIVGAGPVGATAALLLARHGVACMLVDRKSSPQEHPAAHVLSTRTLEIWREVGLERAVRTASAPLHDLRYIVYCTTLAGVDLGRVPILEPTPEALDRLEGTSPTRAAHLPQNRLEKLLWSRLTADDPASLSIDFRPEVAYQSHADDGGGVCVTLRDTRRNEPITVHARYLVAADGAGSAVRKALGIEMDGPVLQHVLSVHFRGRLERWLRTRRGPVVWVHNPVSGLGTFIVHRPPDDWVFQIPYFPPTETPADFDEVTCLDRIHAAIGSSDVAVHIESVRPWVMTAQMARRYRAGNAFLIGDAAHRFPPTGGLGLNTGVHDAHNLAWKLAWVLHGRASEALLDTYEAERRPVAEANRSHSVANFEHGLDVLESMGMPRKGRQVMHAVSSSRLMGLLPRAVGRGIFQRAMKIGLRRLASLEDPGPRAALMRRKVAEAIAAQGPHYRFWGLDLGYCYGAGFVVPDGSPTHVLDVERYIAMSRPGGRIPHAWVWRAGRRVSTLDLVEASGFVLLTCASDKHRWMGAVAEASAAWELPIACLGIGPDPSDDVRGEEVWTNVLGMTGTGALLVRPDGHVAWQSRSNGADVSQALRAALESLLRSSRIVEPMRRSRAVNF